MIVLSLLLNIAVLVPVTASLLFGAGWVREAFGEKTPARGVLLSIYIAIGLVSALLLVVPDARMTLALLLVQIVYKVTTPFTVGNWRNPVVLSNLGIAAFHLVTAAAIVQAG